MLRILLSYGGGLVEIVKLELMIINYNLEIGDFWGRGKVRVYLDKFVWGSFC